MPNRLGFEDPAEPTVVRVKNVDPKQGLEAWALSEVCDLSV